MFKADLSGAINIALQNPGPPGNLGPTTEITIPAGPYQIRTDGIVLFSIGGNQINILSSDVIFPEMAQFIIYQRITSTISFAMLSVGNARVTLYPEAPKALESEVPSC